MAEFTKSDINLLFSRIDAATVGMPPFFALNYLETQARHWARKEAQLAKWAADPHGNVHPFNGDLDAFDISAIRNAIGARIAALRSQSINAA